MDIARYVEQSRKSSQTTSDAIAEALRRAVIEGALKDRTVLRQGALAAQFGVSRIPIREALLKLQADGLVEAQPRRGSVVRSLDADAFQEILEMRMALEPLALRLAIPKTSASEYQSAEKILKEAEQYIERPASGIESGKRELETRWGEHNWAFHRALYVPARRPRLLEAIKNLHLLFAHHLRFRVHILFPTPVPSAEGNMNAPDVSEWRMALQEHRLILAACMKQNVTRASAILTQHISSHGGKLIGRLRGDHSSSPLNSNP